MPPDNARDSDASALEQARRRLYAPEAPKPFEAPHLSPARAPRQAENAGWTPPAAPRKSKFSASLIFLAIAGLFFLATVGVAVYLIVFGGRSVSTDHVAITVGPASTRSGDTLPLLITIQNDNPVAIRDTKLSVDFPETARDPDDSAQALGHVSDTVGDIPAGANTAKTIRVAFFGSENQVIAIPVHFEYRTEDSNAVFVKDEIANVTITSSPLSVSVGSLSQVSAGQPFTVSVSIRSNAATPLDNVAVTAQYPFGFTPTARATSTLFALGTLAPGEQKSFSVSGTLSGTDDEERVFHFTAGMQATSSNALLVPYASGVATITLAKPFLATTLSINQDTSDTPVIVSGKDVQALLSWVNTLTSPVLDAQIAVKLTGDALDPNSIRVSGGYYRSVDNTILFASDNTPALRQVNPKDTGAGTFSFSTKTGSALAQLRNPAITATVSVSGRRVGESGVSGTISSTITRTIQVATDLALDARAVRTVGPFKNTGPWPPQANTESTYTIILTLANTVNAVADAEVTSTLPTNVRFTNAISPTGSAVSYNESSRTVLWDAGDINAGASKQVAFQVALLPSISDRGTSPVLMTAPEFSATDRFTKRKIISSRTALTIDTTTDPAYVSADGRVATTP